MVGWHHQLNGHESEQAPGIGDGQGSLVCCNPWGRKESGPVHLWMATERKKLTLLGLPALQAGQQPPNLTASAPSPPSELSGNFSFMRPKRSLLGERLCVHFFPTCILLTSIAGAPGLVLCASALLIAHSMGHKISLLKGHGAQSGTEYELT
ncbi:uncharacterized protein LOC129634562 isoform X3 [Bubalus kerabau]|uniref:uncharacterized protein LOC129634562 isoform X3 n=1 Tax=Bubalus carabanensis TaxID=3119969 RepID=UPI00244E6ED4|nr:uncharacterized protein LOC129634562 isoform X3 [Bubalus carabanensis]